MACDIAIGANREKVCTTSQGGNEVFYPYNFIADAFTVVDGVATAMDAALTTAYQYTIEGDGNTFTDSLAADFKTGTSVYTQTLVMQLKQVESATSLELERAAQGNISGILKDRNGVYHWVGHENSFNVTRTVEAVSGGARTDFNGYNVTFVAENKAKAPTLDTATVAAFLAIVV